MNTVTGIPWFERMRLFFEDRRDTISNILDAGGCREGWLQGEMFLAFRSTPGFVMNEFPIGSGQGRHSVCQSNGRRSEDHWFALSAKVRHGWRATPLPRAHQPENQCSRWRTSAWLMGTRPRLFPAAEGKYPKSRRATSRSDRGCVPRRHDPCCGRTPYHRLRRPEYTRRSAAGLCSDLGHRAGGLASATWAVGGMLPTPAVEPQAQSPQG